MARTKLRANNPTLPRFDGRHARTCFAESMSHPDSATASWAQSDRGEGEAFRTPNTTLQDDNSHTAVPEVSLGRIAEGLQPLACASPFSAIHTLDSSPLQQYHVEYDAILGRILVIR